MKKIISIVLVIILMVSQTSWAGWLDNWFNQYTSSAPDYFEGQKRGYFTAGSFNARIPSSTTYPFSVELPRLKGGCGGIDAFLGGFGFVNFEYLVQKFQRLIQAAPAVAFQMALNTLSSQLSTIIGDVEKIINALNSVQLNECAMLKPFTTIDLSKDNAGAQFESAAKAALKTTGIADLWSALTEKGSRLETKSGTPPPASEQIEGCSQSLREAIEGASASRGIVGHFAEKGGYSDFAPIVRGMVGDVVVTMGRSNIVPQLVPFCQQNSFDSFKEGVIQRKNTPTANCTPDNVPFKERVQQLLRDIHVKARSKTGRLSSEQEQLVKVSPLPVHKFVKYSVATGDVSLLDSMSDPISKGLLSQAFLDIYREMYRMLLEIESQIEKTNHTQKADKLCNVTHVKVEFEKLRDRAREVYGYASEAYRASQLEGANAVSIAFAYSNFEDNVYKKISEKFSSATAQRVLSR